MQADTLEELFDYSRMFERSKPVKGGRVLVITNGGGLGVIAVDELSMNGLELAELSSATKEKLRIKLPPTVNIKNPLDLVGDAGDESYKVSIEAALADENVDVLLVILLPQAPGITINIIKIIKNLYEKSTKPLCLIIPGGSFADTLKREVEEDIPSFSSSTNAVLSIKELVEYYKISKESE